MGTPSTSDATGLEGAKWPVSLCQSDRGCSRQLGRSAIDVEGTRPGSNARQDALGWLQRYPPAPLWKETWKRKSEIQEVQ